MDKSSIRRGVLSRLGSLDAKSKAVLDAKIAKSILSMQQIKSSQSIFCFLSKGYEVDTYPIISQLLKLKKSVSVPVVKGSLIEIVALKDLGSLEKGPFDIMQPSVKILVDIREVQAWIVPGVAFDMAGNRIGHGAGYFDRFFSSNKTRGPKICPAYSFQLVSKIPSTSRDVPVDCIVTEGGVFICKAKT